MSLRARFALALALLAAASVVAVATTDYVHTADQLHEEVDAQLEADVRPLIAPADPTGFVVATVCVQLASPTGPLRGYVARLSFESGTTIQCLDPQGRVTAHTGKLNLPVSAADARRHPSVPVLTSKRFRSRDYRLITIRGVSGGTFRISRSLSKTEAVLSSIRDRSIFIGIGLIAVAVLAGWLIARRTARPLVRLTRAAEEVAVRGRLEQPVAIHRRDEVGRLARSFSAMLAALDESRAQQQRLVQDASHELRTPLTSLRTNIDTLRRYTDLEPEVRERVLAALDSELKELGTLASELVDLTVDTRDAEPERHVALHALAQRAAELTSQRTGRSVTVDATPTTVVARPDALFRALVNVLDNAVKFSPDNSEVEVTVGSGCVAVHDHGSGIAPADVPMVFDRFYRAVDARSLPGSGLGLSIVRDVVESSGGTVTAANDPSGGAVLVIELPVVGDVSAPEPATHADL
jgi:two-component system sensor histidine kinase MprB